MDYYRGAKTPIDAWRHMLFMAKKRLGATLDQCVKFRCDSDQSRFAAHAGLKLDWLIPAN